MNKGAHFYRVILPYALSVEVGDSGDASAFVRVKDTNLWETLAQHQCHRYRHRN